MKMRTYFLLIICIFSVEVYSQKQNKMALNNELDSLPNWHGKKTFVAIDSAFVLEENIVVNGNSFNYKRHYFQNKGVCEYGNVNKKNIPYGNWMYVDSEEVIFAMGSVSRGFKIGKWPLVCGVRKECYVKYGWRWNRKETIIKKKRFYYD